MKRYGFYADPQLDYPDEQMIPSGIINGDGDYVEDGFDVGRVAIGQGGLEGEIRAAPVQMAQVAAAVANGGRLMRPQLTDRIVRKDGRVAERIEPDLQSTVMKPETAEELTAMMSRVVEEGTGTAAALAGITVAGKTGTAEVGANREFTQPWFIAFAPGRGSAHGDRGDGRAHHRRGRHGRGADREDGARGAARRRRMTEVATGALVDGRYRILRRIGSGGMADVYAAEDTHLGREVALKVLHRRFAQDQEFVERFRREAKAAAGLSHPNVVGVFDRGEHEGTYYIAMEYLTGRTLKEIVTSEAPLAQQRVVDLGRPDPARRRLRPPPRRDPPRLQAAQRDRRRAGPREGHGLRHRARRRLRDDGDRLDHGHRPLPLAGAGAGARGDRRLRPLLDRRDALRDARRQAARSRATARSRSRSSTSRSSPRRSRSCAPTCTRRSRPS